FLSPRATSRSKSAGASISRVRSSACKALGFLACDSVLVHLIVQMRPLDSDGLRRAADVPVVFDELSLYEYLLGHIPEVAELLVLLQQIEQRVARGGAGPNVPIDVVRFDLISFCQDEKALNHILEFAHIPAPLLFLQSLEGFVREGLARHAVSAGKAVAEMARDHGDVVLALTKGRHVDEDHANAMV